MIRVRAGVGADAVRFDSRHVLFVEGGGDDAIDPVILRELLGSRLRIEPLGASFSVASVAAIHYPERRSAMKWRETYYSGTGSLSRQISCS
ncbi:MAG: hypothetical protein OXH96_05275 [Spirochaetaceae bacterium]|nr:hypothetical protein [Spirochaetaceae bacterium]